MACAIVASFCLAGFANAESMALQDGSHNPCSLESKKQDYREFQASYEGVSKDHGKALGLAKKYLACPVGAADEDEVLASLNLAVGRILRAKNSASEAVQYFIRAASYNSKVKTSPQTYAELAEAYEEGPYDRLSSDYRVTFQGMDETDESRLAVENIFQIVDRIIDAYARAVALAGVDLTKTALRDGLRDGVLVRHAVTGPADWIERLSAFYKFRHNGYDAGLKKFIRTVLSTPLPLEPTPLTSLPPRKKH